MCLVSSLGIFNLFSSLFRREGLSLRERKFDLRERFDVKAFDG